MAYTYRGYIFLNSIFASLQFYTYTRTRALLRHKRGHDCTFKKIHLCSVKSKKNRVSLTQSKSSICSLFLFSKIATAENLMGRHGRRNIEFDISIKSRRDCDSFGLARNVAISRLRDEVATRLRMCRSCCTLETSMMVKERCFKRDWRARLNNCEFSAAVAPHRPRPPPFAMDSLCASI